MIKSIKKASLRAGAAFTAGTMASNSAFAAAAAGTNFGTIATNITSSISTLPGLLTALCYLFGILLGALGIMKIKDHVENPSNEPLKNGAIRLAAGGALFSLPILFAAMHTTVGTDTTATTAAQLSRVGDSAALVK